MSPVNQPLIDYLFSKHKLLAIVVGFNDD